MTLRSLWTQHEAWLSLIAIFISPCFHHNLVLYHMFCPRYAFFLLYFFLGCSPFILFHRSYNKSFPHWVQMGRSLHKLHWLNPKFSGKVMFEMADGCAYGAILRLEQNSGYRLFRVEQRSPRITRISRFSKEWKSFAIDIVPKKSKNYPFESRAHRTWTIPDLRSIRARNDLIKTISHVNHFLTETALVPPLIVLTSALSRSFSLKGQNKVQKVVIRGQVESDNGCRWYCLDRVPKGISQVSRRLEVDQQRALNYQLSSGTSCTHFTRVTKCKGYEDTVGFFGTGTFLIFPASAQQCL